MLLQQQADGALGALLLPRVHGRADPRAPDARHAAQRALGVAVDRGEHLAGAVVLEQPLRPARADVLDRPQVGQQRLLGGRRAQAGLAHREAPAVAGVLLPGAGQLDLLALVHVRERADGHDLLALLGDADDDGEVPVGRAPAHGRDLHGQLARVDVEGLHVPIDEPTRAASRQRVWEHGASAATRVDPHRDRHAVRRRRSTSTRHAFVALMAPPGRATAPTGSSSAAPPARPRR